MTDSETTPGDDPGLMEPTRRPEPEHSGEAVRDAEREGSAVLDDADATGSAADDPAIASAEEEEAAKLGDFA